MGKYSTLLSAGGGKYSKMLKQNIDTVADPEILARNKKQVEEQVASQRKIAIPDAIYKGIQDLSAIYSTPSEYLNKGKEQLADNPIAGAINVGQGIVHGAFTMTGIPQLFSVLSTANRTIFGDEAGDNFDNIMNLPSTAVDYAQKGIDKVIDPQLQNETVKRTITGLLATGRPEFKVLEPLVSDEGLQQVNEAISEVNKLGATLLAFKGLEELKPAKVTPIKVIEEPVTPTAPEVKMLGEPQRTFNVQPSGATRIDLTESAKEIGKLELQKSEANNRLATATKQLKSLPKDDAKRKGLAKEIADAQKEFNRLDKEIISKSALLEEQRKTTPYEDVSKQLPQFAERTPVEGTGENIPSNINFSKAVQPEVGERLSGTGRYVEGVPPEKTAPVFRSPQDYIENRKLDLWSVEPKSPLNVDALNDIINVAKQSGIEKEVYAILRTESMKRNRLNDFETAWQDVQNNAGKREVVPTEYTEVRDLLNQPASKENITQETTPNSPISSIEAQGKENAIKSIESISPEVQGSPRGSIESVPVNKQVEINNIQSANDAIKFAELNKGNEDVLNQLKTNLAETQAKATEALKNNSPDAELLQGKASILNDAVNELTKRNQEVVNAKEGMQGRKEEVNNIAPEETTFGATILPSDFTLKNMKSNFIENTETIKGVLAEGARLTYEGITDFKQWSEEMSKIYGEKILPHLTSIWLKTQNVKDNKSEFAKDIIKYANETGVLDTRSGKERFLQNNTENMRKLIAGSATTEQFQEGIKLASYESPKELLRRRQLENKLAEERRGGTKLTTDEKLELESLSPVVDLKTGLKDAFRIPADVAEKNPITNAVFQELFERRRTSEMEAISLKKKYNDLIDKARESSGEKYDESIIRALGGEKVTLNPDQQAVVNALTQFREEAGKYKTDAQLRKNYDFPVKPRGFVEAYHYEGLWEAISEKLKRFSPKERARIMRLYNNDKVFDVFSKERIGRTEHPTMDLKDRLDAYIDVYSLQKNVQPVLPTLNRLNQALRSMKMATGKEVGMTNIELWNRLYQKDVLGEKIQSNMFGSNQAEANLKDFVITPLNRMASFKYLALNAPGGLANLLGGMTQNFVASGNTPSQFITGLKRVMTDEGQKLLSERGIVDAGSLSQTFNTKEMIKGLLSPYSFYALGENLIQGSFYLGKLTPQEFRTGLISAAKDREILVSKARNQGGYHTGLRPAITRTTLGNASMKFRLWVPAVLESKVQKVVSTTKVMKDIINKEKPTTKDMNNVKGFLKDATLVGSSILLLNELNEENRTKLEDALNMAYGVIYPDNWSRQLGNPIPATSLLVDAFQVLSMGIKGSRYEQDTEYGREGDLKATSKALQIITPSFAKSVIQEKYPADIKQIMELNTKVNKAMKDALKYKTSYYVEKYNNLRMQLEDLKASSDNYQNRMMERKEKSIENQIILGQ